MELSPNQFTFDTNRLFKVPDKTLAEVRTAQKNTSSISAADANPDGASKLTPEDTTLAQRPTIVRDLPRRPDTFGYAEAAPASLSKDMEPCWAGGRCPLDSVTNCRRVATNSNSTTPSTVQPTKPKEVNVASLNDLAADLESSASLAPGRTRHSTLVRCPSTTTALIDGICKGSASNEQWPHTLRTWPVATLLRFGSLSFNHRLRRARDSTSSAYVSPTPQN